MSAAYPHWLRIFRATTSNSGGTQDDDGVYTDDITQTDEDVLYDGPADVQDGGSMFDRDKSGQYVEGSDAVAFLKDEKQAASFASLTNLQAEVTWEDGSTSMADVTKVRRLDGTVWLKEV